MTENKRFKVIETIKHDDRRIYELTKNDIGYYNFKGEKLLAHLICNELNRLLEENEQLKQRIKELEIENTAQSDAIDGLQETLAHLNLEDIE